MLRTRNVILLFVVLLFVPFVCAQSTDEDEWFNRGYALWKQRNWNQTIVEFEKFIQTYPNSSRRNDAELYIGHSYLSRGNFVNAADGVIGRQHLEVIINQGRNAKDYKDACLHHAFSLYSLMNYNEARPRLTKYVEEFPQDESLQFAYYYLGMCESHVGNYANAITWFTRALTEYPAGALKAECQLDRAIAIGKAGQYANAERELNNLALDPDYKFSQKAYLQRAYLKIDQQQYNEAIQILESFVQRNQNVQGAQAYIIEAYQYEAHCYMKLGDYEKALRAESEIERLNGITPEAALLKVQILTKLQRFDEANSILSQLKSSQFGLYAGDIIISSQAAVLLAQGRWDDSINILNPLLKIQMDPSDRTKVNFGYFSGGSETQLKLRPNDFLETCQTLVLDYASRFAATKRIADDNIMQQAIFDAMYRYASSQPDRSLMNIVNETDVARNRALITPIQPSGQLVINPSGSPQGTTGNYPTSPDGLPAQPGQTGPGGRPDNPGGFPGTAGTGTIIPSNPTGTATNPLNSLGRPVNEADVSTILNKAGALAMNGDYDRANETLLELLSFSETFWKDFPTLAPAVALMRSKVLFQLKNFREAQMMCNLIVKESPNSQQAVDANYFLGFCYDYYAQQDKAMECFQKVVNSKFESDFTDDSYYYLGLNWWERKNPSAAEDCFRKIYRSYKDSEYWGHAVWSLAQVEFEARNYENAEQLVNEALASKPDKSIVDWLLFLKGEIDLKNRDYEKARIAFNTIVIQYPDSQKSSLARNRLANLPKQTNTAPEQF